MEDNTSGVKKGDSRTYIRIGEFELSLGAEKIFLLKDFFDYSKGGLSLLKQFFKNVGNTIGFKVGLHIPSQLFSYETELWECLPALQKLKDLGHIEGWHLDYSLNFNDEPRLLVASVKNDFGKRAAHTNTNGTGFGFYSPPNTLWAAIGESVERRAFLYCEPPRYIDSSYKNLLNGKVKPFPIFSLAGINPSVRLQKERGLSFTDENQFRWIKGYSLTQAESLLVPWQLANIDYNTKGRTNQKEPLLIPLVSTGSATHRTKEEAIINGVLELIERDAFMITWLNKLSPNKIPKESVPGKEFQKIIASFRRWNLEVHLLSLPTDMPVHVFLSIIIDKTGIGPAVSVGASADFNKNRAIVDALKESLGCRLFVRKSLDYAKKVGKDLSFQNKETIGREERLLCWCDTKKIRDMAFLLNGKQVSFEDLPLRAGGGTAKRTVEMVSRIFKEKKLELAYVEISDDMVKKNVGLHTVVVLAPQLQPLHLLENLPFNWGERIKTVPTSCGFVPAEQLNDEVHPFP